MERGDKVNQPDLTVKNIYVGHVQGFDEKGNPQTMKQLRFTVGDHGPFTINYPPGQGTASKMKADIQAQVDELASLHQIAG